MLSETCTFVI